MQTSGPGGEVTDYAFSHTLNDHGDRVFTLSAPQVNRGDGEGTVTESRHHPASNEWLAALHFPLPNGRGVMEGRWHRQSNELHITSHDAFYAGAATNHVFADLRLRRKVGQAK